MNFKDGRSLNRNVYLKQWRSENPDKVSISNKKQKTKNPERARKDNRKSYLNNISKRREKAWKRIGVEFTYKEYEALLIQQDFKCAGCQKHESEFKRALHVDHCHQTGKIRGLLCHRCNVAIGALDDNPELLKSMIRYLEGESNES